MKRIAVFCDGTWNRADAEFGTNVLTMKEAVADIGDDGVAQKAIYVAGVGSGRGEDASEQWWDKVVGGAFGKGLDRVLEEAYRGLAENYEPKDEVMLFGFSRGAYTARSLAGLIRNCGIPGPRTIDKIESAMALYRARGRDNSPDAARSLTFRKWFSPDVATSKVDQENRDFPAHLFRLSYLGVWDTVGALGIPRHYTWLSRLSAGKYQFHDTDLSSSVAAARHAVAVDERRRTFPPTLWFNLTTLNRRAAEDEFYDQIWFPGDHGSVGGGGDILGLSHRALIWIAEGARRRGLTIPQDVIDSWAAEVDGMAPLSNRSAPPSLLTRILNARLADRDGPWDVRQLDDSVIARWNRSGQPGHSGAQYRPGALRRVRSEIAWRGIAD